MSETIYLDKNGVREIYPPSDSTIIRQMAQEEDPFPPGAVIGGKRYWRKDDVLAWLARQFGDDGQEAPPSDLPATGSDIEAAENPSEAAA